jgi:hypothetical protein
MRPIGVLPDVKQTQTAEKRTFRVMSRWCFVPRHATGKPLHPKVFEASLRARYLEDGLGAVYEAGFYTTVGKWPTPILQSKPIGDTQ